MRTRREPVTSKFRFVTRLSGVSFGEFGHYIEYVPRPIPRAPRTTSKRVRAEDTFASASATKKPCHPSTHPSTQVIGSFLLGERINIICLPWCLFASLTEYFCSFSDGSVVELLEGEDEEDGLTLATCR
jgi:hypothetical protein